MKLNGLGNCYPSLEIPGQILRVLEGKPWAKSRTNLLPKALRMTNFSKKGHQMICESHCLVIVGPDDSDDTMWMTLRKMNVMCKTQQVTMT